MIFLAATLAAAARVFLALLFGQAAFAKLRDLAAASDIVQGYGLLPAALARPVTILITIAEAMLAGLLGAGLIQPNPAGLAAAALLLLFAAAMALTLRRGRSVSCGCGGDAVVSWQHVVVTLSLAAAAAFTALPMPGRGAQAPGAPILIQAVLAGALLFVLRDASRQLHAVSTA